MRIIKQENLSKLFSFINRYVSENNGVSPSLTEIMNYMNMPKSTAYRHLLELKKRDSILYTGKNTLEIKNQEKKKVSFSSLAILGSIPCGHPEDSEESIEGYVAIPSEWIDGKCYLLRATGSSMIDASINDKDLVLIKLSREPSPGQIVAALTEKGTTLKRYKIDRDGRPYLFAENRTYSDKDRYLYPEWLEVQGIALKIIKDVR